MNELKTEINSKISLRKINNLIKFSKFKSILVLILSIGRGVHASNLTCKNLFSHRRAGSVITVNYDDANKYRFDIGMNLYRDSINLNSKIKNIIEIGPGSGDVALDFFNNRVLNSYNLNFIEPDTSKYLILKTRFPSSNIFDVSLESFLNNTQKINSIDLIVANFSLHWVENIVDSIQKINNLISSNGILALSNTDSSRSFWKEINDSVEEYFPGCSLFNIEMSHSFSANMWEDILIQKGFEIKSRLDYTGTASILPSVLVAFNEFKKMTGSKYLKLANGFTQDQIENFVLEQLKTHTDLNGNLKIKASGFQLIAKKNGIL